MTATGRAMFCGLPMALAVLLAPTGAARAHAALWCVPAVAESVLRLAEACGTEVEHEAHARVRRMVEASVAAVERTRGLAAGRAFRGEMRRMSTPTPESLEAENCAAQAERLRDFLAQIAEPAGEEIAQAVEAEAALSRDPLAGNCL